MNCSPKVFSFLICKMRTKIALGPVRMAQWRRRKAFGAKSDNLSSVLGTDPPEKR